MLHTLPIAYGFRTPRWTLAQLQTLPLFAGLRSTSGVWRRLKAWGFPHKRSRERLMSPDPVYEHKMLILGAARLQAALTPATHVFLYSDEFTYYRQPRPGYAYWERGGGGRHQPLAQLSHRANTQRRIVGGLDAETGRVLTHQATRMRVRELVRFLQQVRTGYGPTVHITLAWDNWPNHHHPTVKAAAVSAGITLVYLPTYAPWTNPIEKLWKALKDDVLRIHPWSDAWDELKARVGTWLEQFAHGSRALLRAVGLAPEGEVSPVWV